MNDRKGLEGLCAEALARRGCFFDAGIADHALRRKLAAAIRWYGVAGKAEESAASIGRDLGLSRTRVICLARQGLGIVERRERQKCLEIDLERERRAIRALEREAALRPKIVVESTPRTVWAEIEAGV